MYSGLSYLCEIVLGLPYEWAMFAIALVAALYLIAGGYIASLRADFIQGLVMIAGVLLMVGFVVASPEVGGLSAGIERLTAVMEEGGILPLSGAGAGQLLGLCLLTSVGTWGMPQMVQKFYGVADEKSIRAGTVISTGFCLLISVCAYFIGSLTRLFFTEVPAGGSDQMIPMILDKTLPVLLLGVVMVLVLSASVSTLSGITLSACSAITLDLIAPHSKTENKARTLLQTRLLCFLFIVLSLRDCRVQNADSHAHVLLLGHDLRRLPRAVFPWPVVEAHEPHGRLGGYDYRRGGFRLRWRSVPDLTAETPPSSA